MADKQYFIDQLELIVEEQRVKQAYDLAEQIYTRTGLYPSGYEPHKDGLRWQGYYIHRYYGMFDSGGYLVAECGYETTKRKWWGKRYTVVLRDSVAISDAASLLRVLKDKQPYEAA